MNRRFEALEGEKTCGEMNKNYYCTRALSHTGHHMAFGNMSDEPLHVWPREELSDWARNQNDKVQEIRKS